MTEVKLTEPKLKFSVQQALIGNVTGNLAGLYAMIEAQEIKIVACFFSEPTELDREYLEDAAGMVVADYPNGYMIATEYKLISEVDPSTVHWQLLRAEAYNYDDDPD
jgi:hypothetical protein